MGKLNEFIIKNIKVLTENKTLINGFVKVKQGKIAEMGDMTNYKEENTKVYSFSNDHFVIPGLIDIHIHGVKGSDTMDGTNESLLNMAKSLPAEGTTSFLATTMTQTADKIECALTNAWDYIRSGCNHGMAELVGVHLEGPYISKKRAGAQPIEYIALPDISQFKKWNTASTNIIKVVTLAPEIVGGIKFTHYLKSQGIIASIGHSDATYDVVNEAIDVGVSHVTHLFNGMRGMHHREPGVVGAALSSDSLMVEMIVDGIHIHPNVVKAVYKTKTVDQIILITDSMRAKQLPDGTYELGGQTVVVKGGKALLEDGTLAGSVLKMNEALKNMISFTGCTLEEAVKMASENPAKQLNIFDTKGSIKEGKDADIVIIDKDKNVIMTFCKGELAYERNGGCL